MKQTGVLEFGQLPVLMWPDGTVMGQSGAILRTLGVQYGYYPSDPMERWKVDSTIDAINDIFEDVAKCYFSGTEQSQANALHKLLTQSLPKFLSAMNQRLQGENTRFMIGH